MVCWSVAVLV